MIYRDNTTGEIGLQKEDNSYVFLHWDYPKYFNWPQKFSAEEYDKLTPIGSTCLVEW